MTIDQLIRNTEAINVRHIIGEAIHDTANALVTLQQEQQLRGEDSEGKKIGKYRNRQYAIKKYSQNSLAGFGYIDLRLSGDFYKGEFVDIRDRSVILTSADPKTPDLENRFGEKIFGLNKKHAREYASILAPVANQKFRNAMLNGRM